MTKPTVALVNNAQREHLEFMATVEAVAHENGCGHRFAAGRRHCGISGGRCFHRPLARHWLATRRSSLSRGSAAGHGRCDLQTAPGARGALAGERAHARRARLRFPLHIAGRHNVQERAGRHGLRAGRRRAAGRHRRGPGRLSSRSRAVRVPSRSGCSRPDVTLVDDSYNANPDSVRAAIEVLAELPGPRLLVLGDMGEVGDAGAALPCGSRRAARAARHRTRVHAGRAVAVQAAGFWRGVAISTRHVRPERRRRRAAAGCRPACWSRVRAS